MHYHTPADDQQAGLRTALRNVAAAPAFAEHPWVEGNGKGGANHNADAIAFLQFCWRMFYR